MSAERAGGEHVAPPATVELRESGALKEVNLPHPPYSENTIALRTYRGEVERVISGPSNAPFSSPFWRRAGACSSQAFKEASNAA